MLGDRWGVTDDEVARAYPCDDLVPAPTLRAWRAVTIAAPPSVVWQWVGQVRLAPYSYDWLDNLGSRSPNQLLGLPEPVPGEHFTAVRGRPVGRVLLVEPGVALTGSVLGAVMSYVLAPEATGTRLLLKVVGTQPRPFAAVLVPGDLVMARRQLLRWKALAES